MAVNLVGMVMQYLTADSAKAALPKLQDAKGRNRLGLLAVRQEGNQHRDTAAVRPVGLGTELGCKEALLRASFQPKAEDYECRAQ